MNTSMQFDESIRSEAADPDSPARFMAQWRVYRRRRNLALFLFYSCVPVCAAAVFLYVSEVRNAVFALPLIPIWIAATAAAIWWAGEFRCPRCCRRFGAIGSKKATGTWSRGLFDDICHNCKVRKFAETE